VRYNRGMELPDIISEPGKDIITLREDFIDVVWDGAQNADKVRQSNVEALGAVEKLQGSGKPVLLSLHFQHHPAMPNLGAFREVLKMFRAANFKRVVISGDVSSRMMSLVSTIVSSFDKEVEITYIKDRSEALKWLLSAQS